MRKRRRRQVFRRYGSACCRALVASCLALLMLDDGMQKWRPLHTVHGIKVHDVQRVPSRRRLGISGVEAGVPRAEGAGPHVGVDLNVRTTMDRGTLWILSAHRTVDRVLTD
jgi:hypothetical protein